jgi:hypothetical protein
MPEPRKNLGWANGDETLFPRLQECQDDAHDTGERNLDPTYSGYDRIFWCNSCRYEFHVDSSG